jgi:hypothetical protein
MFSITMNYFFGVFCLNYCELIVSVLCCPIYVATYAVMAKLEAQDALILQEALAKMHFQKYQYVIETLHISDLLLVLAAGLFVIAAQYMRRLDVCELILQKWEVKQQD